MRSTAVIDEVKSRCEYCTVSSAEVSLDTKTVRKTKNISYKNSSASLSNARYSLSLNSELVGVQCVSGS